MYEEELVKPKPKVKFTGNDVSKFYRHVVSTWVPSSQVWSFKHGDDLASGATALSCIYITQFFRKELKLRPHSKLTSFLPVVALSSFGCYLVQSNKISSDILNGESCPVCIISKSVMFQLLFGFGYPIIMAPVINFHMADRLLTYPVPSLTQAPKEVFQLWLKLVKKDPRPLLISVVAQVFVSTLVTQQKMSFFHHRFLEN